MPEICEPISTVVDGFNGSGGHDGRVIEPAVTGAVATLTWGLV